MGKLNDILDVRRRGDPARENPFPDLEIVTEEQMQRLLGQSVPPPRLSCDDGVWISERFRGKRKRFWRFYPQ